MSHFAKPKQPSAPKATGAKTTKKKVNTEGLWTKCPVSGDIVFNKDLEANLMVVPKSGYHFPIGCRARIASMIDEGTFEEHDANVKSADPLKFVDSAAYPDRIKRYEKDSGLPEAVICGTGKLNGILVSLAVMDFRFCGGAMGAAVGEKITRAIERATKKKIPCIVVSASGGARMQEGIFSLMQMAKTSAALGRQAEAKLPFISILTYPTTGGVTASFATLGDVILAEPGAMIGFAGARVIKETTKQTLPAGFQTSEFLLKHGLVDQIVSRLEMKDRLTSILQALHTHKYIPHKVPTASPFPSVSAASA
ncbi:acetyl-CoA carboxylase carboxyltransferase subunit beta [Oleiharenicola lentus]|jgi:acetyl-CoA carboxylase carboxyl transferase subunit beta|uniref:Acetyl-coenzyme A carboxylase carboxyl transferase subunit beta n=1 Tax=Oleiharenicola lentus TaxID=2508720 RepID=A0A4V1M6N9_9BACT|nr:acetyl-CoA carboxylase, carboxyltransferase subunit beta [Oleiharenicola lentus]RXK56059.1 acetyl-CoA carboxylase carboxyltransferase subunit beta [Oleiharenicola lentus]